MLERIPFRPRHAASYDLSDQPPIWGGAEPRQPELQAPSGTYQFFETALAQWQWAGPPNQMGLTLRSFERGGIYLDVDRRIQYREGKTPNIHVTVCQPLDQEFCDAIYSMDITPDDRVNGLSADLNMMGESRGLPKPQPDLDKVLQTAIFVLEGPSILIG